VNAKKILIVEDDSITRRLLRDMLEAAGYDAYAVSDGPEALDNLRRNGLPHLAIIDLGLPTMDGFTLSEKIKRMADVPIIILTGNSDRNTLVHGIENYADDYILKPFHAPEVVARVGRVLSRINNPDPPAHLVEIDSYLSIDFANSCLYRAGERVALTPIESRLLHILARDRGRIISPQMLIARAWPNEEVFEETLRVHLHRLRRKLQPDPEKPGYIYTERGVGYVFRLAEGRPSEES
jgi:DNA-binding response OmpR family regulator